MKIGKTKIGLDQKPFVIAELSGNHNNSLERALDLVQLAAESEVDAVKIQTYTADTITMDSSEDEFIIKNEKSLWKGRTLYDLYDEAHTPWEWHKAIFEKAEECGLLCFSTPFDITSVDFLEEMDIPVYKIASPEVTHLPLIKKVAQTGKPIIMSIGMASLGEIDDAVRIAKINGCKDIALLQCTSSYPASPEYSNLKTIPNMRDVFGCEVGLSDHTLGIGAAIASVALGATIIEKHLTFDRSEGGVDSAFSLEPAEMKMLKSESISAWQSLGNVSYALNESEKASYPFRQSIYYNRDLQKGDVIKKSDIRIIRPGFGIQPKYHDDILGRKLNKNVKKGTRTSWQDFQ